VSEIAWHAAAGADGDYDLIASLVRVADESLSELVDGIECRVDAAAVRAHRDHLHWRPHDHEGAELVATLEARDEAERLVADAYDEARRTTEETAQSKVRPSATQEGRGFLRRRGRRSNRTLPRPIDFGDLGGRRERYGWPRRDAA
jgi:hypothetical protein